MPRPPSVYVGDAAFGYDLRRQGSDIWIREQETVGTTLHSLLSAGDRVLDVAAGTGRWLDVYAAARVRATLLDISEDMLSVAARRAGELGFGVEVVAKDVMSATSLPAGDWLVSTRFFNWIPQSAIERILRLALAAGYRHVAVTVRCLDLEAPLAQRIRSIWSWQKKNFKVLIGARDKGTYYLQSRPRLVSMLDRLNCGIVSEHIIERPPGENYSLLVIGRR